MIIGAILSGHDGRRGYIYHVAVKEEYRKRGIGKKLVDEVLKSLKAEGINKVALVVFDNNSSGNAFWESLGFMERTDLEGFTSTYREDVELLSLEDNSVILRGKEALREKYRMRFEVQKVHATLVNRMVLGNKVIDQESVSGIKENEQVKAIAIYEVVDGLIQRVWFLHE